MFLLFYFISDVLLIPNNFFLIFQKQNIDFSFAKRQTDITIECLEDLPSDYEENYSMFMVLQEIQDFVNENT